MATDYYLLKVDHPSEGPIELSGPEIQDYLNDEFDRAIFNISEVNESDITSEPASIDQGGSVEIGRRRINLRKTKTYSIPQGAVCKLKSIPSPTMLVEDISYQKNQAKIGETKEYEIAQCIWFANNVMNRAVFKAADLELVEKEQEMSFKSKLIKDHPAVLQEILDGNKINAIQKVRLITGYGLKEAKDLVESYTQLDIERFKQGIYR